MAAQIDWVIPAITASASLLGAIVGGFATYWTSKKTDERATAAEEERKRCALLREAATRFVNAMTDISVASAGFREISREWGEAADKLANARTQQELADVAKQMDPTIEPGVGTLNILFRLARMTGLVEEDVQKAIAILAELRLVAPSDIADAAQRVMYTGFAQELAAAMAPNLRRATTDAFNREIGDFVNRVRHAMDVEHHAFDVIDGQGLRELIQLSDDAGLEHSGSS
jgi:hypothetical protein